METITKPIAIVERPRNGKGGRRQDEAEAVAELTAST
jgi:hypothetical protein